MFFIGTELETRWETCARANHGLAQEETINIMDWKRSGPEMGTCLYWSEDSPDRLRFKKFGAHPRIQQRINFKIGTFGTISSTQTT